MNIPALIATIAALEAEIARLRAVAEAAREMRAACPMTWTAGECGDAMCESVCCALDALEATDE